MRILNITFFTLMIVISLVLFISYMYLFHFVGKYTPNFEGDVIVIMLCLFGSFAGANMLWVTLDNK